jgi:TatD DNase family protein
MIDSHAHLTHDTLYGDIENVLARAQAAGVKTILNICTNPATLERGLLVAKKHPWIKNAAATTPHDAEKEGDAVFPLMEQHALKGDLAAVGETGLDYHYYKDTKTAQQKLLRRYLQLALAARLPVVIHCREAFADLFHALDNDYVVNGKHAKGILHCFTGTEAEAEEVLKRGWYLSLSGIVTFKKSEELRRVAKLVPLDKLLVETDAPYLAPQSKRSQVNESAFLLETIETIAQVKRITTKEVADATAANFLKVLA